jgi:hypothetical protein
MIDSYDPVSLSIFFFSFLLISDSVKFFCLEQGLIKLATRLSNPVLLFFSLNTVLDGDASKECVEVQKMS